jgi:hypothetical protein
MGRRMKATALVPVTPSTEHYMPALIAEAGDRAALRFLEFFTVNIRNKNTRAAYARAAGAFLRWCEGQGIGELGRVQPEVSAELRDKLIAESLKLLDGVPQRLAAMDVHRFLAGDLAVSNMSAEFKVELVARCEEQSRWLESRLAVALEPGAFSHTVKDELIATYKQQLRNIESRVSSVRTAQSTADRPAHGRPLDGEDDGSLPPAQR